ncbi:flippase-like domain-containing protein [Candidatus Saccharibacteria bacterium]|nr:flippase-like domain-containing protein [Candidatus Saccharibacteria bacterium]
MSKEEIKAPEAQDEVTAKNAFKKLKKPALTLAFIAINIAVIAITAFSEFGNSENAAQLSEVQINWWFLLPAAACFIVAITLEIHKYIIMMREAAKVNVKNQIKKVWRVARRTVLLGKYYDSVTPAAIGGQPFQIWYMHKNAGIGKGMATTIPIIGMISNQIGFIIVASVAFLFGSLSINNAVLMATACFGLLFYAFWPIAIMIATFLPNTTAELINLIVKFLAKIHIVKDKEKAIKKVSDGVNEYAKCVKQILKTRGLFLREVLLSVCFHLLISMIPFFVLTAFGGAVDFLPCLVTTIAVTSAVYFVPTPGNAGAAEGTFFVVFSALSSGYIFWAMLTWRFFSYYIYIIIGAIIYVRMHFEKKKNKTHEEKLDT